MLPWDRTKGREAYKKLRCYVGSGSLDEKMLANPKKFNHKKPFKYTTMKEVVEALR